MNKKHILCFGDSNTWGYCAQTGGRYEDDVRWTMQLSHRLGEDCLVIEEGLNGRTTVFEDPLNEGLCGLSMLTPILLSHAPLDLMVLMLGTNDCKQRFAATAFKIKDGLMRLVKKARQTQAWRAEPRILIVAPIVIDRRLYSVLAFSRASSIIASLTFRASLSKASLSSRASRLSFSLLNTSVFISSFACSAA